MQIENDENQENSRLEKIRKFQKFWNQKTTLVKNEN